MASPFSELPSELHTSLRSTWLQETRPASVLLGTADNDDGQTTADLGSIAELPQSVHQATTKEIAGYLKERDEAIDSFVEGLRSQTFRSFPEGELFEGVVSRLIADHLESRSLPLSSDTLQRIVEKSTGALITQWFSPMFTVWSDKLRKQGVHQPVIELTWPEHFADKRYDFGEGMRDVELHVSGVVNGEIGEEARNCTFVLDSFKGRAGYRAKGCTIQAESIDGSVLDEAQASAVVCKSLVSPTISLRRGCSLEAETVKGAIREGYDFDEEGVIPDDNAAPCRVKIGHLTGSINQIEGWEVEIGEITEPPKPPKPRSQQVVFPRSYGEEIQYSGEKSESYDSRYIHIDKLNSKESYYGLEDNLQENILPISSLIDDKENIYRKEKMSNLLGEVAIRNLIQDPEKKKRPRDE